MRGIRHTLLVGTAGAMIVLLSASGVLLFFVVRAGLVRQFDEALLDRAAVLVTCVEVKAGKVIFDDEDLEMGEFRTPDGPGYLEVVTGDDTVYRSPSLADADFGGELIGENESSVSWIELPEGRSGRAVRVEFVPTIDDEDLPNGGRSSFTPDQAVLVFARDTAPVTATLGRLETILLAFGAGTIAISVGALHAIIHRGLTPLDVLAAQIKAIEHEELFTAIELRDCPVELKPVVECLNELLGRLKTAFDRERAFSADVAHELRTPLSGLRTTLEVGLTRPRTSSEFESISRDCLRITNDLQAVVENLFTLSRLESGETGITREEVHLLEMVEESLALTRLESGTRDLEIRCDVPDTAVVETDSTLIQVAVRNVLHNALLYTNTGGWIHVEGNCNGECATLRVSNSGSQVGEHEVDRVFDRFWRSDSARTLAGVNSGLGLSLVKRIVSTLGGSVDVESTMGGTFTITISIPRTG